MKKLLCIGLISVGIFSFIGCGDNNSNVPTEDKKPPVEDNVDKETGAKPDTTPETTPEVTPETKPDGNTATKPNTEADKTERIFKIITKDSNYKVVDDGEIKIVGLEVANNLKKILTTLSSKYFDNKGIELTTIESVNSKKIAVINLTGDEKYWHQKMQGSLGGQITEYTLIENVLQRDYKGFWINGVKFTLNGKPIEDTGHIPNLSTTTYK